MPVFATLGLLAATPALSLQGSEPPIAIATKTLTALSCEAADSGAVQREARGSNRALRGALNLASRTEHAAASVRVGSRLGWQRGRPIASVFVIHHAESRVAKKGQSAVARVAQSPSLPGTPHEVEFRLSAPKALIGRLTLTVSGKASDRASGSMEIVVEGAGMPVTMRWAAGQKLARRVFDGVALTSVGLRVRIRGVGEAKQTGAGHCFGLARAAVSFVGPKMKGGK